MAETPHPFRGTERFAVLRTLGSGGMGVVYEAEDRQRAGSRVALKTLQKLDHATLLRFKQEFRSLADVSHPNLVDLHELISEGEDWFFVMELVDGLGFLEHVRGGTDAPASGGVATLTAATEFADPDATVTATPPDGAGRGREHPPLTDPAAQDRLRAAARGLVEGIGALHRAGKLHRDVKPSNAMVTRDGRVIVLDFGLVTDLAAGADETSAYRYSGTIAYMPPEQAAGEPLSAASDWYAVGATLYEALTGRWPYHGTPREVIHRKLTEDAPPHPSDVDPSLPRDLGDLCVDLLRRNPGHRPDEADIRRRVGLDMGAGPGGAAEEAHFVGRETDLRVLADAAARVAAGTTVAVYVHGSSGAGKSALLEQALASLPEGFTVLRGRCYEDESVPYKAVDSLIDAVSRHLRGLAPGERHAVLPGGMAALARVFPVLRAYGDGDPGASSSDPLELRHRAFAALRDLLRNLGVRSPLAVLIDDLQWGDADSAALLSELLRPPDPPRALFLGAYRSEYADRSPCVLALRDVLQPDGDSLEVVDLPVGPLSDAEATVLVRAVSGDSDADLLARIVAEGRGHPYFLSELARSRREGSNWGEGESVELDDLLWRRVNGLGDESRRLLEAVTVSGRPLRQIDAYHAVGVDAGDRGALGRLRATGLVRTGGPNIHDPVEAYHDRVRETVVTRLPEDRRRGHHRSLGETLERAGSADAEALAHHFDGGGVPEKAGAYYAEAGEAAETALAFDRASRLYRSSLEALPRAGAEGRALRTRLGESLANAGRGREAADAFEEAAADGAGSDTLELRAKAAYQLCISGNLDEGRTRFAGVLAEVGMPLPRTPLGALLSYLGSRARLFFRGTRFRERDPGDVPPADLRRFDIVRGVAVGLSMPDPIAGADYQTRSLLLALGMGEPTRAALSLAWEAAHSSLGGRTTRKRTSDLLRRAGELAGRTGDPHARGLVEHATGVTAFFHGDFPACREHCDRAREIFQHECTGVSWERASSRIFAFWGGLLCGDVADLRRRYPVLLQEARDKDDLFQEVNLVPQGGTLVRLAADDPDRAEADMDEVLRRWTPGAFTIQHLGDRYGRLMLALYRGDVDAGLDLVERTWPACRKAMHLRVQYIRIALAHYSGAVHVAAAAAGRPGDHARGARRQVRRLEKERTGYADVHAGLLRAGLWRLAGDTRTGADELRRTQEQADALGFRLAGTAARWCLGAIVEGEPGREWALVARSQFAAQGVADPAALTRLYTGMDAAWRPRGAPRVPAS